MSINAVGYSPVNYSQAKKYSKNQNVSFAAAEKPASGKGQKLAKSFCSLIMTGLGQMCDGRVKTGFKQLGAYIGFAFLTSAGYVGNIVANTKAGKAASLVAMVAGAIGSVATKIHTVVDAYKGGK